MNRRSFLSMPTDKITEQARNHFRRGDHLIGAATDGVEPPASPVAENARRGFTAIIAKLDRLILQVDHEPT